MNKERGWKIACVVASIAAISLAIFSFFVLQKKAKNSDYKASYDDLMSQYQRLLVLKYESSTTTQAYSSELGLRLQCQNDLGDCKTSLKDYQDASLSSMTVYVLGEKTLVEDYNQNTNIAVLRSVDFSIPMMNRDEEILATLPVSNGMLNFKKFNTTLFRATNDFDFTEASAHNELYYSPAHDSALLISDSEPKFGSVSDGISRYIAFSDRQSGTIAPHGFSSTECLQKGTAKIDGISWNGQLVQRFAKPLDVECQLIELNGYIIVPFWNAWETISVSQDLQSVTLPLKNGKKIIVTRTSNDVPDIVIK